MFSIKDFIFTIIDLVNEFKILYMQIFSHFDIENTGANFSLNQKKHRIYYEGI